jgi:hypothetical protein
MAPITGIMNFNQIIYLISFYRLNNLNFVQRTISPSINIFIWLSLGLQFFIPIPSPTPPPQRHALVYSISGYKVQTRKYELNWTGSEINGKWSIPRTDWEFIWRG